MGTLSSFGSGGFFTPVCPWASFAHTRVLERALTAYGTSYRAQRPRRRTPPQLSVGVVPKLCDTVLRDRMAAAQ